MCFFRNYVVQHLIELRKWEVNRNIVDRFRGKFVSMSMNKYGSNVVEKLVKSSGLREVAEAILTEILSSSDLLQVSKHICGNFVVQTLIKVIQVRYLNDSINESPTSQSTLRLLSSLYFCLVLTHLAHFLLRRDRFSIFWKHKLSTTKDNLRIICMGEMWWKQWLRDLKRLTRDSIYKISAMCNVLWKFPFRV